jgi:hypothetical protein
MDTEMKGARSKATWTLVPVRDRTTKILSSKWVYDLKLDNDGFVVRFKARIVAVGSQQVRGVHYNETYAPVTNFVTIRILIALATMRGHVIGLIDVKNAYLNAALSDVDALYMRQPKGFEQTSATGEMLHCRLDEPCVV